MEKSAVEIDDSLTTNSVETSRDESIISSHSSKESIQPNNVEVDDLSLIHI